MNKYNYFLFSNTEEPRALEVDKNCIAGLSLTGDLDGTVSNSEGVNKMFVMATIRASAGFILELEYIFQWALFPPLSVFQSH